MNPLLLNNPLQGLQPAIGLTQINGFNVPQSFRDSNGVQWNLIKDAFNSASSVPDPSGLVVTDYWFHAFPKQGMESIFCYAVEGVMRPKAATELPVSVLYTWFSKTRFEAFQPAAITQQEWLRANVYASRLTDARASKLHAICGVSDAPAEAQALPDLIQMPEVKDA